MISGREALELEHLYPSSDFFSDSSIHMDYASWRKGEIIVPAFDLPVFLVFVFTGNVKISAYREDGSEFVLPSEDNIVIGDIQLMTGKPSPFYAEAVSDIVGGVVSIERYGDALKSDVRFLRGTLSLMAAHMDRMLLPSISARGAKERVAAYINNASGGRLDSITHASEVLHLSRRHIHRILLSLVNEGKLMHEGRGVYCIPPSMCYNPGYDRESKT